MASAALPAPNLMPTAELDSESLYEIVNGERREILHMGAWGGTIASILVYHLNTFAFHQKLGLAMVEVLFRLSPNRLSRRPDVAFVSFDRWPLTALPTDDPPEWEVVPHLAVEVLSPTNSAQEVLDKIDEYFQAGVQLVWVIYPLRRYIYVYESPTQNRILSETDELDGGEVLPGFRLSIAALFAPAVKP